MPTHPFRGWDSLGENVLSIESLDAIETHSGRSFEEENRKAVHATRIKNLPSIGGSDCHSKEQVGRAFTEFTYSVHTVQELIEQIRKGNCGGMTL